MPKPKSALSDHEQARLDDLLVEAEACDLDEALGMLHAVAVAPGLIHPSTWLPQVLGEAPKLEAGRMQELLGLLMGLYNQVLTNVSNGTTVVPPEEEFERCRSFAVGYTRGALLDPKWFGDDERWTFVAGMAFLAERHDLVSPKLLATMAAQPDAEGMVREQMHQLIQAANKSFLKVRRAEAEEMCRTSARPPRAPRNEPCPCGSGMKYKRCCFLTVN